MGEASTDKIVEQEDITMLRSRYQFLDTKRRVALDKLLDIKGSIRVFCRIRPFNSVENWRNSSPISVETDKIKIKSLGNKKEFTVDRAFDQNSTQEDVYKEVEAIIKSAFDGQNVCVLAYGQTGTGKTYTMEGVQGSPGIVLRAIEELFREISQEKCQNYTLTMSMLEVYRGSLKDLLAPKPHPLRMDPANKSNISIMARNNGTVEIEGLIDAEIMNFKQANRLYHKGKRARATSWTNVNETSSRSHCLTRIIIRDGENGKVVSKIWLVDLGGSERLLKTGATGHTLDEGKSINLSLSALGDVIAALKQKKHHVPYRNSKLTQILSDSLGEGSRVVMIVHTSPSDDDLLETICTLTFAKRVRSIESNRELSEETKKIRHKRIAELGHIIEEAEKELQILKMQIEKAENLIKEKNLEHLADESPRSPLIEPIELTEISQNTEQILKKLGPKMKPHFMAPTVSSKHRQSATGESIKNLKNSKCGNKKNMNFSGSQSLSVAEPFKPNLKSKSVDQGPRRRSLSKNVPTVRNSLPQHRRRISVG